MSLRFASIPFSRLIFRAPASCRSLINRAALSTPPPTRDGTSTPSDFLKAIGRGADTKVSFDGWNLLWACDGKQLKQMGLGVRDRRYILWCMEKYREGYRFDDFVHEPQPKKTIRSRGPAVQNGKRIRSRRLK